MAGLASPSRADDSYASPQQVARLDDLLLRESAPPARLVELSRLLADPRDQIVWLTVRAEALDQGDTASVAAELAKLTSVRLDAWSRANVGGLEPLKERLGRIGAVTPPVNDNSGVRPQQRLVDVVDPTALATRLAAAGEADFAGLTVADKALLWARGVPNSRLGIDAERSIAPWDVRAHIFDLALGRNLDKSTAFSFVQLLQKLEQVRAARAAARNGPPFADSACAVAIDLVILATGAEPGVPAANALEAGNLWAWAALARLVEAAAVPANKAAALQRAGEHLAALKLVQSARPDAGAHIATVIDRWHARAAGGGPPAGGDSLRALDLSPLEARRAEKRRLAQECERAAPGDQKFRLMQQAKVAELGFDSPPSVLSLDELKTLLRNPLSETLRPGMHLFLEMLEVSDGRCIGLAIASKTGQRDQRDEFVVNWLGPATPDAVLGEALRSGVIKDEAMIIVAPDGAARSAGWAGEAALNQHLKASTAWVLYIPTAAAMRKGGGWKAVDALRYFYFAGDNARTLNYKLSGANVQSFRSPWLDNNMGLIILGLNADIREHATATRFIERLMEKKRGGGANGVFAVGFAK